MMKVNVIWGPTSCEELLSSRCPAPSPWHRISTRPHFTRENYNIHEMPISINSVTAQKRKKNLPYFFAFIYGVSSYIQTQSNTETDSFYMALTKPTLLPLLHASACSFPAPSSFPHLFDIIGRDQWEKGGPTICNSSSPRLICLCYFALGER